MQQKQVVTKDVVKGTPLEFFKYAGQGDFPFEFQQKLEGLVESIRETGKKGSIAVRFNFTPATDGDPSQLLADHVITVKKPERKSKKAIFFTTDHNTLSRKDPAQMMMEGVGFDEEE